MVSLPELRVVISSTAAVGSWVCQGPPSPSYLPPWSLQGAAPLALRGQGLRRAIPVCGPQLQRGAWHSPSALTPTGGE